MDSHTADDVRLSFSSSATAAVEQYGINPHILFEYPLPPTEDGLLQRLDDLLIRFTVYTLGTYGGADESNERQLKDPWMMLMSRNDFVQQARVMREQLGPNVWTSNVALSFGSVLKSLYGGGNGFAVNTSSSTQTNGLNDIQKKINGNTAVPRSGVSVASSSVAATMPETLHSSIDRNVRERRALHDALLATERLNPRVLATRILLHDRSHSSVDMRECLRVSFAWTFLCVLCHAPWIIVIGLMLTQEADETCKNGELATYLFGFVFVLAGVVLVSFCISLAHAVNNGQNKCANNEMWISMPLTFLLVVYNLYGLIIVWKPNRDTSCVTCQTERTDLSTCECCVSLRRLAAVVVGVFFVVPIICGAASFMCVKSQDADNENNNNNNNKSKNYNEPKNDSTTKLL